MTYTAEKSGSIDEILEITAKPGYVVMGIATPTVLASLNLSIPHEHINTLIARLELARDAAKHMAGGGVLVEVPSAQHSEQDG